MGSLPVLRPREVVARLERLGFAEGLAQAQFRHPDGRQTTVPFHAGRDLAPPLLRQVCRDIGVEPDAFLRG